MPTVLTIGLRHRRRATALRGALATGLCLLAAAAAAHPAEARIQTHGVAVDVVFGEPIAAAVQDVETAAALGADAIRVSLQWSNLQPTRDGGYAAYYLDAVDAVVQRARERNLKVMLTPVFTPCWASSGAQWLLSLLCRVPAPDPSLALRPPTAATDYADLMTFLARRYGDVLTAVEVWNEPNSEGFWRTAQPAEDYALLLRVTYRAVKRVDPNLKVVAGALAGADASFLRQLYAAGIAGYYDVLSVHPYNDGRAPDTLIDPRFASSTFLQGLRAVQDVRRAQGDTRPVWLTEMGWNTSLRRGQTFLDGVSEADQATYLSRALALLDDPSSGISFPTGAFVYRLRDVGRDPQDPQLNYGLMRVDGTAKPSLAAVRAAFAQP